MKERVNRVDIGDIGMEKQNNEKTDCARNFQIKPYPPRCHGEKINIMSVFENYQMISRSPQELSFLRQVVTAHVQVGYKPFCFCTILIYLCNILTF